jgi:pimeloyl-ACP methyl ester carboxylesterase
MTSAAAEMGSHTSFGPLMQIDAGVLNVGYAEAGPAGGTPVVLLHGWPYDIHSYVDVLPVLAQRGYRVIVPYLRGYGTTRFLSGDTVRNGQQSVIAVDTIALMDALGIEKAILGGFDWGARTADIVAALWPERCKALVSVSGYLIGSQEGGVAPLPPQSELQWWYQFYFATERGRAGYNRYRREFARLIWRLASPRWDFDDATFERSAAAFDNPDHVSRRLELEWHYPAASGGRGARHRPREPTAWRRRRLRPHRDRVRTDSGPGAGRRPFVGRRGDHERCHQSQERGRAGVCRGLRPGGGGAPGRGRLRPAR